MTERCEVAVVGGGPVGLAMALQLGRLGVKTTLIERRSTFTRHPKATGVHAKTMEIFRQWGIAPTIRARGGLSPEWMSVTWVTRVLGLHLGTIDLLQDTARIQEAMSHSPEFLAWCSQDVIEPVLLEAAEHQKTVRICYDTECAGFVQDDEGVTLRIAQNDRERALHCRYLVAADGAHSEIRSALGIGASASAAFDHHINVCFRAELAPYFRGRRHMMWWIANPDTVGTLITLNGADRWIYQIHYRPTEISSVDFTPEACVRTIRRAIGADTVDIRIESILPWHLDHALATSFGSDRVFLVGDAAHRFPPTGGFGMNSGIGDAHNLAWKLAAVLRGQAGATLLDTYEAERRPIAELNIRQSMINTHRVDEIGAALNPRDVASIETDEGAALRRLIAEKVLNQREGYWSQGQQFGYVYESSAVLGDGTAAEPSTISDYRKTARPGAHAPHAWLIRSDGERLSIVDLFGDRFVLVTSNEDQSWSDAMASVASQLGVDAKAVRIGDGGEYREESESWLTLYGLTTAGAVLVRPDGHVAARFPDAVSDPVRTLSICLESILARMHQRTARAVAGAVSAA